LYETTRSDVDDGVAAVDMAATEDSTAGKGINEVMTRAALMKEAGSNTPITILGLYYVSPADFILAGSCSSDDLISTRRASGGKTTWRKSDRGDGQRCDETSS
jgi:hypothetical protein